MTLQLRILSSLAEISAADWNGVAQAQKFNPFVSHEFLWALEKSGSATAKTGWAAQHLVLENAGKAVAAAPCYLKAHSQGEYVFDHGWAEAYHRAGGNYYPKLQVSVPFSPVIAPKLLGDAATLAHALTTLCQAKGASSVHLTFTAESDRAVLVGNSHWLERQDIQFHWHNAKYKSFEEFLSALSSGKRKNIRKERAAVREAGVEMRALTGDDIKPEHWDAFWKFYLDTGSRKWGQPYLTRKFFELIHDTMRQHVLLVMAYRGENAIAGALNFIGADTLYGRNWGCIENVPFLHFETCYYQAIDFAIARGLNVVEAGAQGDHKLARGYVPVKTVSFHHLVHPGLSRAVAEYLEHERAAVAQNAEDLAAHAPFKHGEQE